MDLIDKNSPLYCNICKFQYINKASMQKHLKTDQHKRMSEPRFCKDCNKPIKQDASKFITRCIQCHSSNGYQKEIVFIDM